MGGLETILFTFLLTLSGYVFVREEEEGTGWFSGVLFGLLALARPEGLVFAGVAVAVRSWRLMHSRSTPQLRDTTRFLAMLAIVTPYYLWRLSY